MTGGSGAASRASGSPPPDCRRSRDRASLRRLGRVTTETPEALGLDGLPVDPALVEEAAGLPEAAATARHAELAAEIETANKAYYEADAPILSDAEYDQRF